MNPWPFRKAPAQAVEQAGVLFGLDPPKGCNFKLEYAPSNPPAWFASIERNGERLAWECALLEFNGNSDERAIKEAARKAIAAFGRLEIIASLEGCYPPKRTTGEKAP